VLPRRVRLDSCEGAEYGVARAEPICARRLTDQEGSGWRRSGTAASTGRSVCAGWWSSWRRRRGTGPGYRATVRCGWGHRPWCGERLSMTGTGCAGPSVGGRPAVPAWSVTRTSRSSLRRPPRARRSRVCRSPTGACASSPPTWPRQDRDGADRPGVAPADPGLPADLLPAHL